MKKLLKLLILPFIFGFLPKCQLYANVYADNVQNSTVTDTWELKHSVKKVNRFRSAQSKTMIADSGDHQIGYFRVQNNTRDGFKVMFSSSNGGVLKPDSTSDGEEDIDYILKFNLQGSIDPKLNLTTEVSTFTENEVYNIIAPEQASIKLDSPSDFQVDINLSVDDDVFRMAGNYADTITITYEDL
jgi:hypothetical protein